MADNTLQTGLDNIATDELATLNGADVSAANPRIKAQRTKVVFGSDGTATDVDATHPLPSGDARTYGYAAGVVAATVDVPAQAHVKRVSVIAGASAAATITIAGGQTITVPAGAAFDEQIPGEAPAGADVVIGGTVQSYYVSWVT
jgi:hypothetical protein